MNHPHHRPAFLPVGLLALAAAGPSAAAEPVGLAVEVLPPRDERFRRLKLDPPKGVAAVRVSLAWEAAAGGRLRRSLRVKFLAAECAGLERLIARPQIRGADGEKLTLRLTPKVFTVTVRAPGVNLAGKKLRLLAVGGRVDERRYRLTPRGDHFELAFVPFGLGDVKSVRVEAAGCVALRWELGGSAGLALRPPPTLPNFDDIFTKYPHLKGAARFVTEAEYLAAKEPLWAGPAVSAAAVDPDVRGRRLLVLPGFVPCGAKIDVDNRVAPTAAPEPRFLEFRPEFPASGPAVSGPMYAAWRAGGSRVATAALDKIDGGLAARFALPAVYNRFAAAARVTGEGVAGAFGRLEQTSRFRLTRSGRGVGELGYFSTMTAAGPGFSRTFSFAPNFETGSPGRLPRECAARAAAALVFYDLAVTGGGLKPEFLSRRPGGARRWSAFPPAAYRRTEKRLRLYPGLCPAPVYSVRVGGRGGELTSGVLTAAELRPFRERRLRLRDADFALRMPAGCGKWTLWVFPKNGEPKSFTGAAAPTAKVPVADLPDGWRAGRGELRVAGYRPLVLESLSDPEIDATGLKPAAGPAVLILNNWTEIDAPREGIAAAVRQQQTAAVRSLTAAFAEKGAAVSGFALVRDGDGDFAAGGAKRFFAAGRGAAVPETARREPGGVDLWVRLRDLLADKRVRELHPRLRVVVVTPFEASLAKKESDGAKAAREWVAGRAKDFGLSIDVVVLGDPGAAFAERRFKRASKRYPGRLWMFSLDGERVTAVRPAGGGVPDPARWLAENAVPKILE